VPSPIEPPIPPPEPVETGAKRHLHRFKKAGVPVRHVQGVAYYRQVCDCGDTKVAP
jgi:SH3-like domain-containing protein